MKQSTQRAILVAVIVVAVVGFAVWTVVRRYAGARQHTIDATITMLDVGHRTARIEFIHPRSGLPGQVSGAIPENCPIYINDELAPRGLADLRVGDQGTVRARIHADQTIEAEWVRVRRPAASSQPASVTQPAGTSRPASASQPRSATQPARTSQPGSASLPLAASPATSPQPAATSPPAERP